MLKIRPEQMQAFDAHTQNLFEERAIRHLRTLLPDQTALFSDDELRARIRGGRARAQEYGLESERQIVCFVDTGFLLSPHFDTDKAYPWARSILTDPRLTANQRAGTLLATAEKASGYKKSGEKKAGETVHG